MITYDDLPRELNLATHFVDRNVEEGRGGRTALIGPDGATTYAELAELVNRSGNLLLELGVRPEERPARARRCGRVRRPLVRRAEDRRGHRRGVHVPPAEGLRLLPRLHARGWSSPTRRPRAIREAAEGADGSRDPRRGRLVRGAARGRLAGARAGCDDQGRRRALEVHDRLDRTAEGRRPPDAQPGAQLRVVRPRRPRPPARRRRPPRSEALLRLRA